MTPSMARVRIGLIAAMGAVVALAAGDVFDRRHWSLLVAPALVGLVAILAVGRGRFTRLIGVAAAVVGSVVAAALLEGGDLRDAADAFSAGPRRLLSTEWPSPSLPDLVATVAMGLAVLVAVASLLAPLPRLHLSPLFPIAVAQGLVVALSAPGGERLVWLLPLSVLGIVFALLRPGVGLRERTNLLLGERQALPIAAVVLGLTALLSIPVDADERADPRVDDEPERTVRLIDPIEATLALGAIDPPEVLHTITIAEGGAATPTRWRTAALTEYDGRRWETSAELRPIGRRLAEDRPDDLVASVVFTTDDLQLVPLPGEPVLVDAAIDTDPDRTIVRLSSRPAPGTAVEVRSRPAAPNLDSTGADVGDRAVDETVTGFTEFATTLIAEGSPDGVPPSDLLGKLRVLEQVMRTEFLLDPEVAGGGLQRGLVSIFLRETRRGTAEQFATSFVLLARSLDVDARVATGFVVDASSFEDDGDGRRAADVLSSHAAVWPEVSVDGEWIVFDPVPEEETTDVQEEIDEPDVQSPAAPQPPIPPPPDSNDDPDVADEEADDEGDDAIPAVVVVGLRAAAVVGALLVPVLLVVLAILGVKWLQRRRRLAGPATEQIRGAWAVATNHLVDAGLTITPASTNDEIADSGAEIAPDADREIHRLATLASAATFGAPARTDLLVEDATSCLDHVETSLGESRTRWQRLRWRLSLRSLRRGTRSPV